MKTIVTLALVLVVMATPALAQAQKDPHKNHNMSVQTDKSASTKAFMEANDKMHKDMDIQFTGDADKDFLKGMIPHHQGAIDMAQVVLKYGKNPKVRALAEEIIKAQKAEIAAMQKWLEE